MKKEDLNLYASTGIGLFILGGFAVLAYQGKKESEREGRTSDWSWPAQRRVKDEG